MEISKNRLSGQVWSSYVSLLSRCFNQQIHACQAAVHLLKIKSVLQTIEDTITILYAYEK
jgi:hypothetical protein